MRSLVGFGAALLFAGGLLAQQHGNYVRQPVLTGGFGNVVFPGGTAANVPGIQRNFGSFVSPLGSGPRLTGIGPNQGLRNGRHGTGASFVYSYPVMVGGYGYGYAPPDAPPEQQQQQGNVTVIYPPQPAPVIINQYGPADPSAAARPRIYEPADAAPDVSTAPTQEPPHYLLAFKDHTIYSAVAYWVDGETLHYFTSGNTHNQASLSLIDRDLTARLNQEAGMEVKLPAPKQ